MPRPLTLLPALVSALVALWFAGFIPEIAAGEVLTWSRPWIPGAGIDFAFLLDGLSLLFALMVTGIGAIIFLYSAVYFKGHPKLTMLLVLLSLFAISMLGLVLADDAITLFVFWEGTTITSFLLVGFDHEKEKARDNALQALIVTGLGGLALLAGLILLGAEAGTFRLSEMNAQGELIKASALYLPILILVFLGAFTKSAQFPFHFWLPGAMAAPTPVSAYLHSATMVKAGIYLLARLTPALGGTDVWFWTLTIVGAVTMVWTSILALKQTDLKLMLAYTTVMALGALTMFLGGGTRYAAMTVAVFLIVHALYKAALFLTVGLIDKGTGTREVNQLGGLARVMPVTLTIAMLAALSMAGFPPFIGFIGKELIYEASLGVVTEPLFVATAALLANANMVAAAGLVAVAPFFGKQCQTPKTPADPTPWLWVGPALLAVLGLTFGVIPSLIDSSIVTPVVQSIIPGEKPVELKIWHGVNLPLMLSLLTFGLGFALFYGRAQIRSSLQSENFTGGLDANKTYFLWLKAFKSFAAWTARTVQGGQMTVYLRTAFVVLGLLIWGAHLSSRDPFNPSAEFPDLIPLTICLLIAVSAAVVLRTGSRLYGLTALGVVGAGIAILFVFYSAIDVAITQLLVEMLVVLILAVALVKLPTMPREVTFRAGDAVIASALGLGVAFVLAAVVMKPFDPRITEFFNAASYPEAFGRNVVNVILVDFRALDTLGEVAVVLIAAISAVAALTAGKRALAVKKEGDK
ncbi:MAG: proton-conducting transporter membrane subunit [Dinoroseobacter sp.]|nr:proton-conducting transporter membrane subunit [Dinoroseobacter sp.]